MESTTADREIIATRVVDAPRELVFEVWTEREHVEKWWVPNGTTTHEWDMKPGGLWRYSMPGQDGNLYPYKIKFIEIKKPSRLVYDFGTDADQAEEPVRTSVSFDEEEGKTKVTLQLVFASAAAHEEAAKYGAIGGTKATLKTVADYVEKL